ncbi:MAG TPA: dihydrofolate reductase family protein [Solirubrobacteraceae bacterium]|nr:dihydrofolate reductase family protein [Solirubrobacteraceae bacterium]
MGAAIRSLKHQPGPPLRSIGSLSLVKSLLRVGEVDRLRLMTFPLILGATGREPLFVDLPDLKLELVASEALDSMLVAVEYGVSR